VRRKVTADRTYEDSSVVTAGLKKGDKVIVQGLNGLRQGTEVKPTPASTPQKIAPPQAAGSGKGA